MLRSVVKRIFFWAIVSEIFAYCIQAQYVSSVTNQANIAYPPRRPAVGVISRIGLGGQREVLSSIENAQVGVYHKDNFPLSQIPIPVHVPVPVPVQVPVPYLPFPLLPGPIRQINNNALYKPRPLLPAVGNAVYPARPGSKPGSYSRPRPGSVTGRNSALVSNTNNLIGLELGGLLGGLFQGGGSGGNGLLGTGLLGGGGLLG